MDRANGAATRRSPPRGGRRPVAPAAIGADGPRHVALIPDGNRRWASQRGLSSLDGHRAGSQAIDRFIDVCRAWGVAFVTLWPISQRNLRRQPDEVHNLFLLLHDYVLEHRSFYHTNQIRFRMIGDAGRLYGDCAKLIDALLALQAETAAYATMTVTMAFNYSGRDEIVRAAQRLISAGVPADAVDETVFARHLDTADQPDPDLILRTGGDNRLSGFLAYQAEYAELRFTDTLMPDLENAEVEALLTSYSLRRYSQ